MHFRCVLEFLYPPNNRRENDVVAEDYFDNPAVWANVRPGMSVNLCKDHDRAKKVNHLTYARLDATPEAKLWRFVELTKEILEIFEVFLKNVDRSKLGDEWAPR